MGVYDTFVFECPHCGKETQAQSKLRSDSFAVVRVGSVFEYPDNIVELKEVCDYCHKAVAVVIKDNTIVRFIKSKKITQKELLFGDVLERVVEEKE